ncbi:MAG: hypothetical protein K5641_09070 [Lachnospiraceae bacterium]|nr:hypothetical protein [Lachnospiraceae bacterium]
MSLLERVNPVYNTAKMALGGLALSGDRDAVKITDVNQTVTDILKQTGFDFMIKV